MTLTTDSKIDKPRGSYLEQHALDMPNTIALCEDETTVSWAEWNDRSNRLADALEKRGLRARDRVAVRMMNRIEWFIVEGALAKLGALRVAVSFRLRPSEVRYMLEHSKARAFVFDDGDIAALAPSWDGLDGLGLRVGLVAAPGVETLSALEAAGSRAPRFTGNRGEAIVYTSGTTGHPKGVHKTTPADPERLSLLKRIGDDLRRSVPMKPGDRNLLAAPLNHAAAPASALGTHARGGTVYLLRKFEPEQALCLIARHRITTSFLVPTMLSRILSLPAETLAKYDVSSLRVITTGASVCPVELKQQIAAYFGPSLYENYGATEVGLVTILTPEGYQKHPDSCGRLIDGVQVRITDEQGKELPRGEVGQIYIKSAASIGSYLDEAKSGADFTDDGYFTAGDIGKLDQDDFLYILDRKKDMIIAGGVNIYPAEIEAVLRQHPAVFDVAVFGTPHPELGEQVHAVCEPVAGQAIDTSELLSFAAERLARYKLPRAIDVVAELPRSAIGKVLKRELRAPHWDGLGRVI
jgi:long-chain acyl-CoA synthetase